MRRRVRAIGRAASLPPPGARYRTCRVDPSRQTCFRPPHGTEWPDADESERAAGRTLTVDDVIELLTRITTELPDAPDATAAPDAPAV